MAGCLGKAIKYTFLVLALMVAFVVLGAIMNQPRRAMGPLSAPVALSAGGGDRIASIVTEGTAITVASLPDALTPTFNQLCRADSGLTTGQQEKLAASMIGKAVTGWTGKVYAVRYDENAYKVQVDMVDGFIRARHVELWSINREVAIGLKVGQPITFDGTIRSIDSFMGNRCRPLHLIDATIY